MKKAKAEFDRLAEKMRSGEEVSFGQMEKVYAEAFTEKFFECLDDRKQDIKESIRKIKIRQVANENEMEIEDVNPEEIDVDPEEIATHEMEIVASVMGCLGVKPRSNRIAKYVRWAAINEKWKLLERFAAVLGDVKDCAIVLLEEGETAAYQRLLQHYPNAKLENSDIQSVYINLVNKGSLQKLHGVIKDISSLTGTEPGENIAKEIEKAVKKKYIECVDSMSEELKRCVESSYLSDDVLKEACVIFSMIQEANNFYSSADEPILLKNLEELYLKTLSPIPLIGMYRYGEMQALNLEI